MVDKPKDNPLPASAHSLPWESIDPDDTLGKYAEKATEQPAAEAAGASDPLIIDAATQRLFEFDEPSAIASDVSPTSNTPAATLVSSLPAKAPEPEKIESAPDNQPIETAASIQKQLPLIFHEEPAEETDPRVETETAIAEPVAQTEAPQHSPNRPLVVADISNSPEPKAAVPMFQNRFDFARHVLGKISKAHVGSASTGAKPIAELKQSSSPADADQSPLTAAARLATRVAKRFQFTIQKQFPIAPVEIKPTSPKSPSLEPAQSSPSASSESTTSRQLLSDGGGWTITALCVGLALIAACIIIPQADANRRLAYQGKQLAIDLGQIQKQVSVNKDFLQKIQSDPQLAERLAQRQMKLIRQGETVLDIQPVPENAIDQLNAGSPHSQDAHRMSPFFNNDGSPRAPLPAYEPTGGQFAALCRQPQTRLYILGAALFMVAAGLVLGSPVKPKEPA